MQITGLSVWRIEANNPQPTGFGVMGSQELSQNAEVERLCVEFVTKIWDKDVDRTDTRVHVFASEPDKAAHAAAVKGALWDIAREIDLEVNSERVARWISESRWAERYVVLIIGFQKSAHSFTALVLTESAKEDTFLVTRERLLSELDNIFKRVIYKGIIYPYFDWLQENVVNDKAKVHQTSTAQYILDSLALVPQITPSQLVSEALQFLVREQAPVRDFENLAYQVVQTAAAVHEQTAEYMTEVIQTAALSVHVDTVKLQASFRDLLDRRISVAGGPGEYTVIIRGATIDIKSGNRSVNIEDLFREG